MNPPSLFISIIPIIIGVIILGVGVDSGEIIESERISNWGLWGAFQRCPNGTLVQGFRLLTEPYRGPLVDDTASNALRLYCGDPDNINTVFISSTEGHWGDWGNVFKCRPGGFIYGFQLRVEAPFLLDDETATDNFRFFCTNDPPTEFIEGDGLNRFGAWRSTRKCARTEGLCALQTQVEPDKGLLVDDTALNNILAECCPIPT